MRKRTCGYDRVYAGRCGAPVEKGRKFCKDHYGLLCRICKRQATRECIWESMRRRGLAGYSVKVCRVALCGSEKCRIMHYKIAEHYCGPSPARFSPLVDLAT